MVFICLSSVGLPGLNGFVGEVLVLFGMFDVAGRRSAGPRRRARHRARGVVPADDAAAGVLRPAARSRHHEGHGRSRDLNGRELADAGADRWSLCLLLGVYPQPVLDAARPDLDVVATILRDRPAMHAARTQGRRAQPHEIARLRERADRRRPPNPCD